LIGQCCPKEGPTRLKCCDIPDTSLCGSIESGLEYQVSDSWGYSINAVASPADCCLKCEGESKCKSWTWIKDAGLGGLFPGQCWLKGGLPESSTRKNGVVSGLKARYSDPKLAALAEKEEREEARVTKDECIDKLHDLEYKMSTDLDWHWAVHKDHVESEDACCSLCKTEPSCRSWTFVIDAHLGSGLPGQCWIKGGIPMETVSKDNIVSGLRERTLKPETGTVQDDDDGGWGGR